jgi:hypothetical protein
VTFEACHLFCVLHDGKERPRVTRESVAAPLLDSITPNTFEKRNTSLTIVYATQQPSSAPDKTAESHSLQKTPILNLVHLMPNSSSRKCKEVCENYSPAPALSFPAIKVLGVINMRQALVPFSCESPSVSRSFH